jgi:hypothetical protein
MKLQNLNLVELNAQEMKEVEGGITLKELAHYIKDWWNGTGWFRVL